MSKFIVATIFTLLVIASPMSLAASWAYKIMPFHYNGASDYERVQSEMNALGKDGWELVSASDSGDGLLTAVFKKKTS